MDLKEIQHLLSLEGGKIIIVENERPIMVILPYGEYVQRAGQGKLATESLVPQAQAPSQVQERVAPEELTIEDLPI